MPSGRHGRPHRSPAHGYRWGVLSSMHQLGMRGRGSWFVVVRGECLVLQESKGHKMSGD